VTVGGATYVVSSTDGTWHVDLASDMPTAGSLDLNPNGSNAISVTATDAAGNSSPVGTQTLVIDTTAPEVPVVTSLNLTNIAEPVIEGTAEVGADVAVTVGGATYVIAATDGTWSVDLASATPVAGTLSLNPNGPNAISVIATDLAGNASLSGTQTLFIDTTAPSTPVVTSQGLTNAAEPV